MPLPERDFNQELEKTRGATHALKTALDALLTDENLIEDPEDPAVLGVRALAEVLADRLDDLCHMHGVQRQAGKD